MASTIADSSTLASGETHRDRSSSIWRDAARRFSKNKLALGALMVMLVLIFAAIFADIITPYPYDYSVLSETLQFPNSKHWLGTDAVGRDFLSRLIYGTRVSLIVGFAVQIVAVVIGLTLGTLAGMLGGWVDYIVMRWVEVLTAIPGILFALFLISIIGRNASGYESLFNVVLAIGLIGWVDVCRLTRAQLLSLREKEFVTAAHALGSGPWRIATRHLLPNALAPLIVAVTLGVPSAIFAEAGLSFLGLGINDPLPSWGKMVAESNAYIRVYWHLGLFPTIMIAVTMLTFSFVGDGLRDALDPYLNK